MRNLYIIGHPGLYGGAGSELYCQIKLWHKGFPDIKLHIIPTQHGVENEPLYQEMKNLGIEYHSYRNYCVLKSDDSVINFCSSVFLQDLSEIYRYTKRIMWVNCMTFLFNDEKKNAKNNYISHYLYQRSEVLGDHQRKMCALGSNSRFLQFSPYFNSDKLEYSVREKEETHIGRISRVDADKFAKSTLHIYEYIVSPKVKRGHFLGWGEKSLEKVGQPLNWIKTYANQDELSVKDFYNAVDFIVQPTDTTENLPRIGFESFFSGKPLVVDNRGGWKTMIEHGISGFLCDTPRDFIYWGSRLAYEPELRERIAQAGLRRGKELASFEVSKDSWQKVFESVFN